MFSCHEQVEKGLGFPDQHTNSIYLVYFRSFQKEIPKQK